MFRADAARQAELPEPIGQRDRSTGCPATQTPDLVAQLLQLTHFARLEPTVHLTFSGESSARQFRSAGTTRRRKITESGDVDLAKKVIWLPFLDTYRTLCLAPEPGFKRLLEEAANELLVA